MAELEYRPLDGGPIQAVEMHGPSEEIARTELLEWVRATLGQVQSMAPRSPAVEKFIEAASHMHDLRQAAKALEKANSAKGTDIARFLRSYAVVTYSRTRGSNVRPDLDKFIALGADDIALSAQLKTLRNKFVAHSENRMLTTTPIVDLRRQPDGAIAVDEVFGITVETPIPHEVIRNFEAMLERLIAKLTHALTPLKAEVTAEISQVDAEEMLAHPKRLQFIPVPVSDWSPDGARPRYPKSQFAPVHIVPSGETSTQVTITK
ncbi:hypothetical protein [Leifsonia sp. TF02-11]|uniref:hypothetical protein n=1 Tax=Leifsonia sp. TF02-11 TaxID=2815212 RepID=UPI001AA0EF36|nr:hypothetical protein [Leifsonia sp. TF02-11]MBO1741651.1 hypothetical protein [Leifsonia sp. TF02-11]